MSRYAILENGKVKNIVKADAETAAANGWVEAVGEFATIAAPESVPVPESEVEALIKTLVTKGVISAGDAAKIKGNKR